MMVTESNPSEEKPPAKPWFLKPKRTPEQIAIEGRSPNRQPRVRNKRLAMKTAGEIKKERILNRVATRGETLDQASMAAGCGRSYGEKAVANSPEYRAAIEAAKEEYRRKAEGVIDERLEDVAKEVVKISLKGTQKNRLNGGLALLRGRGVLKDNPVVAVNNDNRKVILVIEREGKSVKELEVEIGKRN